MDYLAYMPSASMQLRTVRRRRHHRRHVVRTALQLAGALVLFVLMLLAVAVNAAYGDAGSARLRGAVLDAETLEPVAGATVSVGDQVATTDASGRFDVADLGADVVVFRVRAAGYEDSEDRVEVGAVRDDGVVLVVLPVGVAGEVVEVTGVAPRRVTAPGQRSMSHTEVERVPGARGDVIESVKSMPGVAAATFGDAELVIRGAAPEDSGFLIDGVIVPSVSHFWGIQSVLPSELIEDIEFVPGGFGVEYGQATGGIVHIHTRPSRPDRMTGHAELSFINVAGFVEGPVWKEQNLSFAAGFRRSFVDTVIPALMPDDADLSFTVLPYYYDAQARLDWVPSPRHRVSFLGLLSFDRFSVDVDQENDLDPNLTGLFEARAGFQTGIGTWAYRTRPVDNTLVVSTSATDMTQTVGADRFVRFDGIDIGVRDDMTWRPHRKLTVRVGGDASFARFDIGAVMPLPPQEGVPGEPNFTEDPVAHFDGTIDDVWSSAYAAVDVRPVSGLTLTPGVRADYFSHLDATTVSPRVSVAYAPARQWKLRGAVGHYSRPTNNAEYVAEGLSPETAVHAVAGAEYAPGEGAAISATGFDTELRDLVVVDPTRMTDNALDAYVNRGTGHARGIEAMARLRRDRFFGWVAYTLTRTTRRDAPGMPSRLADHDQTHNLVAVGSWRWGKWRFGGRFQYATGTPHTPVVGSIYVADRNVYRPEYGAVNSERLEAAHQLDLRVDRSWQLDGWRVSAYVDVTNVYAHAQTLSYSYNFDYSQRKADTTPPILPALGVRGEF